MSVILERKSILFADLSEEVRSFLLEVSREKGLVVRDDQGRACFGVVPYYEVSAEERQEAMKRLRSIQRRIGEELKTLGVTEDDIDRAIEDNEAVGDDLARARPTAARSNDPGGPIPDRYQAFLASLVPVHEAVGESMRAQGVTEDDIDRLLQEDEPRAK